MAEDAHTEDLRTVHEGDTVEIVTSENEAFEAKCVEKEVAGPFPVFGGGLTRETRSWHFDAVEHQLVVTIIDDITSPDDPEFPIHEALVYSKQEGSMGYINDLTICGES